MKRAAAVAFGVVALALVPLASPSKAASGPPGVIAATAEAYAYRIEYDLPLPAGTGTVGHVNAMVSRAPSGESAHGIAGAPTEFDPVVAGKYVDPAGTGHPQRVLPQSECYYPGALLATRFVFPTDTQKETSGLPPTSYAVADCGAGPSSSLHAHNGPISDPNASGDGITADAASSDALARPDHDLLGADATSRASGVSLASGALRIGSVLASGTSSTTGSKGGGRSRAAISVNEIRAGTVVFSLSSTDDGSGTGGKVELTSGGQTSAADSAPARSVVAAANQALKPSGCQLTVLSDPARYPQGFIFSRPEPETGVRKDGTLAASYRGGLLVVCEVPDNAAAQATKFSPERIQVVVGFVYTSTAANSAAGGFGLGDLAGGVTGPVLASGATPAFAPGHSAGVAVDAASPVAGTAAPAPSSGGPPATARSKAKAIAALGPIGMGSATRILLGLVCVAALGWLTHLGASRFRHATGPCPPGDRP